jgi:hypothetical protein
METSNGVKKTFWLILLIIIMAAAAILMALRINSNHQPQEPAVSQNIINQTPMKITSPQFLDGENIPVQYTCDGAGVNPPLNFSEVPPGIKSLALIMHDPDAPVSGGWTHWTLWNIDPAIRSLAENSAPSLAVQGKTSSGQNNYGGPCPPSGTHHYYFKLYALDTVLKELPSYSEKTELEQAMAGHILAQAELVGLYSRAKK